MTRLLEQAFATASELPDDRQDEVARLLLELVEAEQSVYVLTPEEEADLDASIAAEARGEMASDADVRAFWAKYGR